MVGQPNSYDPASLLIDFLASRGAPNNSFKPTPLRGAA